MTRGMRGLLLAVACGAPAAGPAPAVGRQDPPRFTAYDSMPPAWRAGDGTTSVTIAPGASVTFAYPSPGSSFHNVSFTGAQPSACTGLPPQAEDGPPEPPGWSGSCRFDTAGTYAFICQYHPETMKATVVVREPDPGYGTPTPTPATPTPTPTSSAPTPPAPQSTLKGAVKLAHVQHGSRVRGAIKVEGARSRLEVSVWARLSGKPRRVGRWTKRAARAGSVTFSVPVSASARRALRRAHRLPVTVDVALTPPGGHKLTRTLHATLRPG